jgi:GLPGLI family protein
MFANKLVLVLFFLPFILVYGQKEGVSAIVEYQYSSGPFTFSDKLLIDNHEAVYIRQPNNAAKIVGEITKKDNVYTLPTVNYMTGKHMYFSSSKDNNILTSTMSVNKQPYIVKDSTVVFEWIIDNDSKKTINNFECIKATTRFRGRDYIAYFTTQIPVSFGPYKFKGLPGLILEISNQEKDNLHRWVAVKIETIVKTKQEIEMPSLELINSPRINMFEFQNISKSVDAENMKAEQARLPAGVSMTSTITNLSIELFYEWEIPENDKKKK